MKQNDDETETVIAKGHHVDGCVHRNGRLVVVTIENGVIDVTAKMKKLLRTVPLTKTTARICHLRFGETQLLIFGRPLGTTLLV